MKRGKISAEDRACARLLDQWQHRPEFGDPVGCVTTTFTFDAAFFEEHCLARFLGMDSAPDEDERTYLIEREEKLSQVFAAVLVDQAHVPAARSLRWHALPARVPGGGILHAKLSVLAWQHRVRVLVGSANMTEPGYRLNFENLAALDFGPEGGIPLDLLRRALDVLDDVREFAPGARMTSGPQPALRSFLRGIARQVASWPDVPWARGEPTASLLVTGPTSAGARRPDLFSQLRALWPFAPADEAWVMSPFFDDGDAALATLRGLEPLLLQRGQRDLHFIVSGHRHPDGMLELDLPRPLATPLRPQVSHHIHRVVLDPDEPVRRLHAKSLWLRRADRGLHCIGSSNFTAAGTGARETGPVNVEVNLAYAVPDLTGDFGRVCERAYPPSEEVDPDGARFLEPGDRTPEAEGHVPLPGCFGSALLVPGTPHPHLALEIVEPPPAGFRVAAEDGVRLLDEASWRSAGAPALVEIEWTRPRAASHLLVAWPAADGERTAIWTVNASDPAALPPPEELRELTLSDLLDVLSSAGPAHEVLRRRRQRQVERAAKQDGPETDPHRKVAKLSKTFLLRRMRLVSAALEELRARLEKPVYSREALLWRLHGPFGPIALADRLVAEEPAAAAFLLAEVALTLRSVTLTVQGELPVDEARAALRATEDRLAELARTRPAPPNLADYVAEIFAEARP